MTEDREKISPQNTGEEVAAMRYLEVAACGVFVIEVKVNVGTDHSFVVAATVEEGLC